ncbi:hypothetical protein POM88_039270 [Heracleum sosnowskyi]|uniref:Uncharacterized protein n=1 Tax=Heracleum sosnowskyi TaxID=360622 RepID=A0AAD8M8L2_9APIA|nr:hypothetical protein POM88_039270 [Heracleum sosnowskyi]
MSILASSGMINLKDLCLVSGKAAWMAYLVLFGLGLYEDSSYTGWSLSSQNFMIFNHCEKAFPAAIDLKLLYEMADLCGLCLKTSKAVKKMKMVEEEKMRMVKKARLAVEACDQELKDKAKEVEALKMDRQWIVRERSSRLMNLIALYGSKRLRLICLI